MLNRTKLLKELEKHAHKIFYDISNEIMVATTTWRTIIKDKDFQAKIKHLKPAFLLPTWSDDCGETVKVQVDNVTDYQIIGVDGSQIYPDRHQGTFCFLLNIGSVVVRYGAHSFVQFDSEPSLHMMDKLFDDFNANEFVDGFREEKEFAKGMQLALDFDHPCSLLVFDGSLIFWNLVSKPDQVKERFLKPYTASFETLYKHNKLYCSYVSLPRNKELINLVKIKLADFNIDDTSAYAVVQELTDIHLMQAWLPEFHRTIIFKNHAPITQDYPQHLAPYFFYINVASEIARVEIPAFIAQDEQKVNLIASIMLNQSLKGMGYPTVLAESHEQAVVKNPDKEFFYQLINKMGFNKKLFFLKSQKNLKKRKMAI